VAAGGVAAAVVGSADGGVAAEGAAPERLLGAVDVAAGAVVEAVAEYGVLEPRP
jgi:hypothetical protein